MLDSTIDGIRILLQHGNRKVYYRTNRQQLRIDDDCIVVETLATGERRKLTVDDLPHLIYCDGL